MCNAPARPTLCDGLGNGCDLIHVVVVIVVAVDAVIPRYEKIYDKKVKKKKK